jgi:hypothetical protein
MVKEIVFTCDICAADGGSTPATHVALPVTIGNRKPKMLELCDPHHEQLIAPVLDALTAYGYTEAPAPKKAPSRAPAGGR